MARYLIETSATDGYLIEDGTGVLLIEEALADAEAASAAVAALDATVLAEVFANAEVASATGTALDTTVTATPFRDAAAEVASATGTALDAAIQVAANAEVASATGTAYDAAPVAGTFADAGVATAIAAAYDPTGAVAALAGIGSGTGAAFDTTVSTNSDVNAEVASATGAAFDPTIPAPVWTAPPNGDNMIAAPELTFTIPVLGADQHFWLEIDTVATFDGGDLRTYRSDQDQTGWDFWNGASWASVPAGGVDVAYQGNDARLTVPTDLTNGTWYRRVRAGV